MPPKTTNKYILKELLTTYFSLVNKENKNSTGVGDNKLSSQIDELEKRIKTLQEKKQNEEV